MNNNQHGDESSDRQGEQKQKQSEEARPTTCNYMEEINMEIFQNTLTLPEISEEETDLIQASWEDDEKAIHFGMQSCCLLQPVLQWWQTLYSIAAMDDFHYQVWPDAAFEFDLRKNEVVRWSILTSDMDSDQTDFCDC